MKAINKIALALISLLAIACNHVFKEYDKKSFPTYSWKDGQVVTFKPQIEEPDKTYLVNLAIRYHYGLEIKEFPVNIRITSPSGKTTENAVTVKIRDENNEHIGSCAGDICDGEMTVSDKQKFEEKGEYTFEVTHGESGYRIPEIMEVGLIIDVAE